MVRFLTLSLLMALVSVQVTAHAAKPCIGEKQVFPLPDKATLCPAPNGGMVAAVKRDGCHFFTLDERTQQWLGPDTVPDGFRGWKSGDSWPPYGWARDKASNAEFFILNMRREKGVQFDNGKAVVIDLGNSIQLADPCAPRHQSPIGDSVLTRLGADGPMVLQSPTTKTVVEFPIQNHPAVASGHDSGTLSPDGKWMLMVYNYDHLDHYSGGYLQLFDSKGDFAFEIAQFSEDASTPAGEAHWLQNNWIVYFDGKNVVFTKFTEE
jgi:hypothetical protein